ncbi:hypothetical protein [Kitasatospora sp. NPDC006786]|uniref:hypothetical protein n=1 Tax=unclassified Kitasatospora TaxID=2633591 RepID=UPI0033F25B41
MTTPPPRRPHPWTTPLRPPAHAAHHPEPTGTAADRMLRDDHRSHGGRCVRCAVPWPCATARSAV